ncbi:hypothetical protein C8R44DRAFT_739000 [Mycena epipterygia]|nr:hypothetical protein C8R44DRAFT_739000 [Mycena epipterygia]
MYRAPDRLGSKQTAHIPGSTPESPSAAEFDPYAADPLLPLRLYSETLNSAKQPLIESLEHDDSEQPMLGDKPPSATVHLGSSRRFNFAVLLPAILTSLIAAGAASALLGWLLSRRVIMPGSTAFNHALVAAESRLSFLGQTFNSHDSTGTTMYGLALSSLVVHLVPLTTPFVLSVFAYLLASMWLKNQRRGHINSLPTPTQYGHLVGLCGSFGLPSLYDTGQYLSSGRKERPAAATTLVAAFIAALVALVINYALSLSDLWLHTTATTFSYQFSTPIATTLLPAMGSRISTTICPGPSRYLLEDPTLYSNCQHSQTSESGPDMFWGNPELVNDGAAVLGNTSVSSQIQMIGNVATLLPKTLPTGVQNVIFSTMAMEATCQPLTQCQMDATLDGTNSSYFILCPSFTPPFAVLKEQPPDAMPMLNQFDPTNNALIFQSGTPDVPAVGVGPQGHISSAGYALNATLNPAGVLTVLYWDDGELALPNDIGPSTGWYAQASAPVLYAFYLSSCVLDVWNITVLYSASSNGSSPTFEILSPKTHSDFNTTSALLGALDAAYSATLASHLTTALQGSLNVTSQALSNSLAGNLSQGVLAYAAPLTERGNATTGETVNSATVSRYPLVPLGLVLALTYGYALLALGVGIAAFNLSSRKVVASNTQGHARETDLVHLRLTSARACIADRFDDEDHGASETWPLLRRATRLGAGFVQRRGSVDDAGSSVTLRNVRRFKVDVVENLEGERNIN